MDVRYMISAFLYFLVLWACTSPNYIDLLMGNEIKSDVDTSVYYFAFFFGEIGMFVYIFASVAKLCWIGGDGDGSAKLRHTRMVQSDSIGSELVQTMDV